MDVKTIGVIGAGPAGREIARAALLGGYRTILEDVSPGTLEQATAAIEQSLRDDVTRGRLKRGAKSMALWLDFQPRAEWTKCAARPICSSRPCPRKWK